MAKEDDLYQNIETTSTKSSDLNNSIVDKVKSLIPETITKWFGKSQSIVRRRDSDSDDDSFDLEQPPSKRAKMPEIIDELTTRSEKLLNGSLPNMSTSHKPTDLLNNIRPRQSFRNTSYNLERSSYSRDNTETHNEPVAGPSGIQQQYYKKSNSDTSEVYFSTPNIIQSRTSFKLDVNDEKKTDSGGSTSGCSSMAYKNIHETTTPTISKSTKQNVDVEKQTQDDSSSMNSRSVKRVRLDETDKSTFMKQSIRTLFPDNVFSPRLNNPSLASRRPSFNTSTFNSPKLIDKTLTTERITTSPFYAGRTMFGGAAAYRKFRDMSQQQTVSTKNAAIQLKPTNEQAMKNFNSVSMSQTARRILDTLEHFSTPINDARKMPRQNISSKKLNYKAQTKPLIIPTVPDILQIRRDKLMERKRKIVEDSNAEKSAKSTASTSTTTTNTLSKFDPPFQIPKLPPKETTVPFKEIKQSKTTNIPESNKTPQIIELDKKSDEPVFKFSSPIKINNVNPKAFTPVNNFKFSKPLSAKLRDFEMSKLDNSGLGDGGDGDDNNSASGLSDFKFKSPSTEKRTENDSLFKVPTTVSSKIVSVSSTPTTTSNVETSNSLLDKFKPPANTWECTTCLIRNKLETNKCIACETLRQNVASTAANTTSPKISSVFTTQAINSDDKWKCTSCLIENSNKNQHCVACTALKPGTKLSTSPTTENKSTSDSWTCKLCMKNYRNDVKKCTNCQTTNTKPENNNKLGFGKEFQKKSDEWECPSCMVRNIASKLSCVCCEAPKPGTVKPPSKNEFKFSMSTPSSVPFKFGIDKADIKTAATSTTTSTFSFGVKTTAAADNSSKNTSTTFTFGVPPKSTNNTEKPVESPKSQILSEDSKKLTADVTSTNSEIQQNSTKKQQWQCSNCWVRNADDKSTCVCCGGVKPGSSVSDKSENSVSSTSSPFKFGLDKVDSKTSDVSTTLSTTSQFVFGIKPTSSSVTSTSNTIATTIQTTPASGGFTFVNSQTDVKKETTPIKTTSIIFGAQAATATSNKESESPKVPIAAATSTNTIITTTTTITTTTSSPIIFGNVSNSTSAFNAAPATTASSIFGNTNMSNNLFAVPNGLAAAGSVAVTTTTTSVFGAPIVTTTATNTSLFMNNTQAASSSFGTLAAAAAAAAGNSEFPKPSPFGSNTTAPVFGSSLPSSNFTFGVDKTGVDEKKPLFSFGSNTTAQQQESSTKTTPFSFSSSSAPANPSTNIEFGAKPFSSMQSPSTASEFSFNTTTNKPPAAPTPLFSSNTSTTTNLFGGLQNSQQQNTSFKFTPTFGAATGSAQTVHPPQPVFGAPAATSNPPAFQFGSTVVNQQQQQQQQQPSQIFSFGTPNQTQTGQSAPTPAFGSAQSTPSIPTFNPNTKPIFNFTSGSAPTAFTAQPTPGNALATSQRKIKRAVRRTRGGPS